MRLRAPLLSDPATLVPVTFEDRGNIAWGAREDGSMVRAWTTYIEACGRRMFSCCPEDVAKAVTSNVAKYRMAYDNVRAREIGIDLSRAEDKDGPLWT